MRAELPRSSWVGLLLVGTLLIAGCATVPSPSGRGRALGYSPLGDSEPEGAEQPGAEPPHALASPPPSEPQPEQPQRLHRRKEQRQEVTRIRRASAPTAVGGPLPGGSAEPEPQDAALTRQALLGALEEASSATNRCAFSFSSLSLRPDGLAHSTNGLFTRSIEYGSRQVPWLQASLDDVYTLASVAAQVDDPDMQRALLRLAGPRLQAATSGAMLLAAWLDFLHLTQAILRQGQAYPVERLFMDLDRIQKRLEPTLTALASREPSQVEAATAALPRLMGELSQEFLSLRDAARLALERAHQAIAVKDFIEMVTVMSSMKWALPRLPPAAPALTGVGLVMSSGGVMVGSRIVVTADWVEMMRRLVQAGVLSASAVSAAVRIHAGQVMMAQANSELPQGVREALGDGPEVGAMHETGKVGAGMAEPPRHHVLSAEFREWFEKRGFTGAMDIDQFCVELEVAEHQALHGGGNWRLGRTWPGEWNQMIMKALRDAETEAGRMLTRNEILDIVATAMRQNRIPVNFIPWRGR